ncbi:hypothetical protein D3C76_1677100 [compost metagenome]
MKATDISFSDNNVPGGNSRLTICLFNSVYTAFPAEPGEDCIKFVMINLLFCSMLPHLYGSMEVDKIKYYFGCSRRDNDEFFKR